MTRPSVGKAGTNGCFVVEITKALTSTRSKARRWLTREEAQDFYDRSCSAHQQKANRERVSYTISFYRTETPKTKESCELISAHEVKPL
jgi:hypothetical protein